MSRRSAVDNLAPRPVIVSSYEVGRHLVRLSGREGRWTFTVDQTACGDSFATRAEAWEAGVRAADRLDRLGPAIPPQA